VVEKTSNLRDLTRGAVREHIAERALALFDEHGFDETTVEDIAAAAGISTRSFWRYFPAKEDVVLEDPLPLGYRVRDALLARPPDEPPWQALRASFEPIVAMVESDPARWLRVSRVILNAPSLRARNLQKHSLWAQMLVPIVAERVGDGAAAGDVPARALFHSALACFDVALEAWSERCGTLPLSTFIDAAFGTR
jgi:AcrR family transcriptional regulator